MNACHLGEGSTKVGPDALGFNPHDPQVICEAAPLKVGTLALVAAKYPQPETYYARGCINECNEMPSFPESNWCYGADARGANTPGVLCRGNDADFGKMLCSTTFAEFPVTSPYGDITSAVVGSDSLGHYVVHSSRKDSGSLLIYHQRLDSDGAPVGDPERVSPNDAYVWDDLLDVDGTRIVYDAYLPTPAKLMVADFGTGTRTTIIPSSPTAAVISGDLLAFTGYKTGTQVFLQNLCSQGSGPAVISSSAYRLSLSGIGQRLVVWQQKDSYEGSWDAYAYNISTGTTQLVSNDAVTDDMYPRTSGSWVVWYNGPNTELRSIQAYNIDTAERLTIAQSDCTTNYIGWTIDGNIVAYSKGGQVGCVDRGTFVFRLDKRDTFCVESFMASGININGNLLSYISGGKAHIVKLFFPKE